MNFFPGSVIGEKAYEIGIRPEHLNVVASGGELSGKVASAEHLGSDTFVRVDIVGVGEVNARVTGHIDVNYGDEIALNFNGQIYRFDEHGLTF